MDQTTILSLLTKVSKKDIVRITWLDAVFHLDGDSDQEKSMKNGGVVLHTVGSLVAVNRNGITVVAEVDEDFEPSRDFNTIPLGMVKKVEVFKNSSQPLRKPQKKSQNPQ